MLCRSLFRCRHMPKFLDSSTLRMYHPCYSDRKLRDHVPDYEMVPKSGRFDFVQQENEHIHKLLASNKLYVNTIAFLDYLKTPDENCTSVNQVFDENYEDKPAYVLLCYLKLILKSCNENPELVQNPKVVKLCGALCSKMSELRNEHLWNLMKLLTLWPVDKEDLTFFDLCKAIDEEAVRRYQNWSYNNVILTMDHFYRLRTLRYSEFAFNAMRRLWRNPGKLTPQQTVHAMFLVNTNRKWHFAVNMFDVEAALMFHLYDLSVEEVGVIALAFFKTRKQVQDVNLVESMYNKLKNRVNDVDRFTLTAYLKFFRFCTEHDVLAHKIKTLLDELTNRVDELPIACCIHIALLGSRLLVFHQPTLLKICEKLYDNIESARLKDLERLAFVLQLFNFTPDSRRDILERIVESLRNREEEISERPRSFLSALHYLSYRQCYDHKLVNKALSIPFLRKAFGTLDYHKIPVQAVHLSVGVKLECPDYKGSYLGETFIDAFSKKSCYIPASTKKNLPHSWVELFSVQNVVCRIFGSGKYAHMMYLLPYASRADVFFCIKDKQPVEIPQSITEFKYLPPRPLPDLSGAWYAVVLLSKWNVVKETGQPIGSMLAKLRHLELLGCKTIPVDDYKYEKADKMQYMKDLIDRHTI